MSLASIRLIRFIRLIRVQTGWRSAWVGGNPAPGQAIGADRLHLSENGGAPRGLSCHLEGVTDIPIEAERVRSIIGAFYEVYNYYGYGLTEAVYGGALEHALRDRGHEIIRELVVPVQYQGRHVCWIRIDFVVDHRIVVENKATEKLSPFAERQLFNYLRATSFQVGLLLHFGPQPRFRRLVDMVKRPRVAGGGMLVRAGSGSNSVGTANEPNEPNEANEGQVRFA